METDQCPAQTSRHGERALPIIPCICSGVSVAVAAVSVFFLSESEWFPRVFITAVLTLFTGGLLPLFLFRTQSPSLHENILQYICIVGCAICTLTVHEDGFLCLLWLLALCVVFALRMHHVSRSWARYGVVYLILGGIIAFFCQTTKPSLSRGERVFHAYGCFLCHGGSLDSHASFTWSDMTSPMMRERLYLHFYAPELTPNATCPPTPSLFVRHTKQPGEFSPWELPVKISADEELVPSPSARALADFLLSLRPPNSTGNNHEAMLARGESLFYAKCAACHGRNGLGDGVNYPPLTDITKYRDTPDELRQIIFNGKSGIITVHGREWNSMMRPPGISNEIDAKAVQLYLQRRFMP